MEELSGPIQTHYKGVRVQILRGDITKIVAHVIVNAANTRLQGGGGIDGNIHRAAGPGLRAELEQLYPNGGEVGRAYITGSHNMQPRVRAIVHAIGPNYAGITTKAQKETKAVELRSAYLNSLDAASNCKFINGLTVVLPCISTGIFGYPMEEAANIALQTIHDWIETHINPAKFERIVVLLFGNNDPNEPSYKKAFP
ncbi:A1pp-domain-containing protein [Acephala macrosclerotiorum]|nr:A1pp-domain-containing protein [Acephala macrosclerotiorum]